MASSVIVLYALMCIGFSTDIDECADPKLFWDCTAGCENLNGTYKCLPSLVGRVEPTDGEGFSPGEIVCRSGFKLSADGSECQDINECDLEDIDSVSGRVTYPYCEHKCENTIGSYICHCPEGYHLLEDRHSCILDGSELPPVREETPRTTKAPNIPSNDICPLFKSPANGKASCNKYLQNGFNYTGCNITCNAGYILQGSQFASCGHTGLWSSPEAKCVESLAWSCPALTPPRNGRFYPASCNNAPSKSHAICELLCDRGYLPASDLQLVCTTPWGWIQRRWQADGPQYEFQQSVKQDEGCVKIIHP
ncbi:GD14034 [Drosophila simulans]|uniref:GD14034 n=1 Tax=Drosophila simulans TaxID=7240 RepID=B4QKX5_DROSI|nr:GD14034 [Drosophila simulans]